MLKKNLGRAVAALTAMGVLQAVAIDPAVAKPTPAECTAFSIQVCGGAGWTELGYSSLGACRLQEYANCMAGPQAYQPLAFKPASTPAKTVKQARPFA